MKRTLLLVVLAGCGVDLTVPDDTEVSCRSDADCPEGRVCATRISTCVSSVDEEAPRILGVDVMTRDQVRVVFSEPVSCAAVATPSAYAITPSLSVSLASGGDCDGSDDFSTSAILFTSAQTPGASYTLSATAITDSGGNELADDGASTVFQGFGQAPDASPPDALVPPDASRVLGGAQPIAWTTRPGATSYIVDVATDAEFNAPIAGSPFTVTAPATTLLLEGLADVTYYWRVRSNLTADTASLVVHDFDVLLDTVYVHCAGVGSCDDTIVRNGSRTRPYASVQRALAAAAELSTSLEVATPTIKVAARTGAAPYQGAVVLQWQSVRLLGGFDATFTTQNTDPAATVLESAGAVLVVSNLPPAVSAVVENLTLRSSTDPVTALSISAASGSLTVRNVAVRGLGSPAGLVAVNGGPAVGPLFENCRFSTSVPPLADTTVLLNVSNAAPTFRNSVLAIDAGAHQQIEAVVVSGPLPGDAVFDGFDLFVPAASSLSRGFFVDYAAPSTSRVVIRNATVSTGAAPSSSAIVMEGYPGVLIEHSHIAAGPASSTSFGIDKSAIVSQERVDITIRDSIIEGPVCPSHNCAAVRVYGASPLLISSSFLLSHGSNDPDPIGASAAALVVGNTNPIIVNTVLGTDDPEAFCIDQSTGYVTPIALISNALLNCRGYRGEDQNHVDVLAQNDTELAALNNMAIVSAECPNGGGACGRTRVQLTRRFATDPIAAYQDLDGADNDLGTIADNDYHLLASADAFLRTGGVGETNICAPLGENAPCGITTTDFYGDTRGSPFSIGHDEVP